MQAAGFKSNEYEMSLPEIAKVLGISTSRAYELQVRAIHKVRRYCKKNNIKFEDFVDGLSVTGRGR